MLRLVKDSDAWGTATAFISIPLIIGSDVVPLVVIQTLRRGVEPLILFALFRSRKYALMKHVSGTVPVGMLGILLSFAIPPLSPRWVSRRSRQWLQSGAGSVGRSVSEHAEIGLLLLCLVNRVQSDEGRELQGARSVLASRHKSSSRYR